MAEPLRWSEAFSVGHKELDTEHHRMIDAINLICLTCHQPANAPLVLLEELERITEEHFEHEEAMLERLNASLPRERLALRDILADAQLDHAAEHRKRLSQLANIIAVVRSQMSEAIVQSNLCEELKAWFVDHAIGYEAQMKTIIRSV